MSTTNSTRNILITGGSGLIGTALTELLLSRGYSVSHLSRSKGQPGKVNSYRWDIGRQEIDPEAIRNANAIVHLAGANLGEKRWTEQRKKEILESRTRSTRLLHDALKKLPNTVDTFVTASAVGYYGTDNEKVFTETDPPGKDFLADVTRQWENEADRIAHPGLRVVKLRTGVVLSPAGGALEKMALPVKFFAGAPLGSGRQFVSWIHIMDLCSIYVKALEDESLQGIYNAVAPEVVTNREFTRAIGKALNRPVFLPPVPAFALKMVLGEMAGMVLEGACVSGERIQRAGYTFQYPVLKQALADLLARNDQ